MNILTYDLQHLRPKIKIWTKKMHHICSPDALYIIFSKTMGILAEKEISFHYYSWRYPTCLICMCVDHSSGVLKKITHNLDYCDIMVLGEELRAGLESLELQHSALLGKHLEYANSSTGMSIYGKNTNSSTYFCFSQYKVLILYLF